MQNAETQRREDAKGMAATGRSSALLIAVTRVVLTALVPVLLVLGAARLVMSPAYLALEYHRPGFPDDYYGFTLEDRLHYAPYAVDYLFNGEGIEYLGNLRFPNDTPLFNSRELRHMRDVKVVTQFAMAFGLAAAVGFAVVAYLLSRSAAGRKALRAALFNGSVATLGLIAAIVILSITSWDVFFTGFHNLFFASGTWQFLYSDTLIRLFPEQFWFDTAIVIGGLTTLGAVIILTIAWRWQVAANKRSR